MPKSIKQEKLLLPVLHSLLTFTMTMACTNDSRYIQRDYAQYQDRSGFFFAYTRTNERRVGNTDDKQ